MASRPSLPCLCWSLQDKCFAKKLQWQQKWNDFHSNLSIHHTMLYYPLILSCPIWPIPQCLKAQRVRNSSSEQGLHQNRGTGGVCQLCQHLEKFCNFCQMLPSFAKGRGTWPRGCALTCVVTFYVLLFFWLDNNLFDILISNLADLISQASWKQPAC